MHSLLQVFVGWRGYAAATVVGAVLGGAMVGVIQQVTIERLRTAAAQTGERQAQESTTAVTRAAEGKNNAMESVSRLPDGGAADRLREQWSRD